jgi:hypothetical protein
MATFFFILSIILFIGTFGMHANIKCLHPIDQPRYTSNFILSSIPWVSGFIFSVIPLVLVFNLNWLMIFFVNLAIVYYIGPLLTRGILERFASGKGIGYDMTYSFFGGILSFILALVFR